MKKTPDLKKIFGKFAGKELKDPNRLTADIDTVLAQMETEAQKNGLKLRVLFPGARCTRDHRKDRVNVHLDQGKDGKLRVSSFGIG